MKPPSAPESTATALLQARALSRSYQQGEVTISALKSVSFSVQPGEFVALVGPSGSGKSTLLNLLGLNDIPTSGELSLSGETFSALSSDAARTFARRKLLGFLFQQFHLLPSLSVLENCILPALLLGASQAAAAVRAGELLRSVGLDRYQDRLPHQLSGGEMQRVALCRALIHRPVLILADEPTGALDQGNSHRVLELLQQVVSQGTTVLMATHSTDAMAAASRVLRLRDGELQ